MSKLALAGAVVLASACGAASDEPAATPVAKPVAAAPEVAPAVAPAPPTIVPSGHFDFRLAAFDPDVIGKTQKCDVGSVDLDRGERPVLVHCLGHGSHDSTIAVDAPRATLASLTARTQIEVRIDAAAERDTGAEARTTLVRVVGQLAEPERPSRCLCTEEREREREASRPKPPEAWDFHAFARKREALWGTTHACKITRVGEIMKSAATARDYSVGRVFDPEQLPFAAEIYCSGTPVIVGARSPHELLALESDQLVDIELGWSAKYEYDATGKLGPTRFRPEHTDRE